MSREGQYKVKVRPRRGQGKVKVRSMQHKHNLNCNYSLMGFDIIEINLVTIIVASWLPVMIATKQDCPGVAVENLGNWFISSCFNFPL